MKRYFNTTGYCRPELHYMVDPLRGLDQEIDDLITKQQYFAIHAPRQTGKTTLLHSLAKKINRKDQYISVIFSVESAGYRTITDKDANFKMIKSLYQAYSFFLPKKLWSPTPDKFKEASIQDYLYEWAFAQKKPIVLLIDEIDSLYDDILVSTLRQLRNGFQLRPKHFPSSIALVGLRDVRDYKLKVSHNDTSLGSGSPFNIKAESFLLPVFSIETIEELYSQHTNDTNQKFEDNVIEKVYEFTGGQPWLVNAIANEMVLKICKKNYSQNITLNMAEQAKENLIKKRDTHLDSLVDKLQENRVKEVVTAIINGGTVIFDNYNDKILYCRDLGIIAQTTPVRFANKIYQEIILRIAASSFEDSFGEEGETEWYINSEGQLDMEKVLKEFQKFYRRHAEHWIERFSYKEAGHQLLLMAFLQRIINGGGRIEREMAVGRERTDLIVEFKGNSFVLELKLNRFSDTIKKGLTQLSRYLDVLGLKHGYLILFEIKRSNEISWEERIQWSQAKINKKMITIVKM